jgi:hypothetical protein
MADLPSPRPMTTFNPFKPALVRDPMNDAVLEGPGVTAEQWKHGASWHDIDGETVVKWYGLLFEGWQPVDDATPRLPLPDDCQP